MSHLNYFERFESKSDVHEDQLTRAFLVLMRFSPSTLFAFYDALRNSCLEHAEKLKKTVNLPSLSMLQISAIEYDTQTATISHDPVRYVLSVLLTDEPIEVDFLIAPSDRKAIYDGIIKFGSDIAIIIENKPNHDHIWKEQLNPSAKSLPEDTTLINVPSVVEWKSIIKSLNQIREMGAIGGAEKLMIDDFLSFVSKRHPSLNPFDLLSQCGSDTTLIRRRIESLLTPLTGPLSSVRYRRGWGMCMNFDLPEIKSVGVIEKYISTNSGNLMVSLYFGDTQSQSKAFYKRKLDYEQIKNHLGTDWRIKPNFHVGAINSVPLRLDSPPQRTNEYLDFWRNNRQLIKQHNLDGLLNLITKLKTKELVNLGDDYNSKIEYIKTTKHTKFNICPSIGIHYKIPFKIACDLDKRKELVGELYKRIKEGLNIVLSDVSSILKAPKN